MAIGDTSKVPQKLPQTTLLSWVWIAFTIEVDNAVEAAGSARVGRLFRISLPMWTNGLRLIDEHGVTVNDLRLRARASCNVGGLERWGWITVGDDTSNRRDGYGSGRGLTGHTILRPTPAGVYARSVWPGVLDDVESRWQSRFGAVVVDSLRQALLTLAVPMPWSPPEVYPANGFRVAVADSGDTTDTERPLIALLGQVLTSLTMDHERLADVSLPLGANVLRVIGDDVVRVRDLPQRSGVSKQAIAMAMTYLQRSGMLTAQPDRCVALTPVGRHALDDYRTRAAHPGDNVLRAALTSILTNRDALSAGLVPPEGCWRGVKPYLTQTERLLATPTDALPWQPMVLHRGGWPDGS